MRKSLYIALLTLSLAGAFLAGSLYTRRTSAGDRPASARKVLYYVDPMHPAYRSDKPGIAPDCGMQLEAVYAGGGEAASGADGSTTEPAGAMKIDLEKQQRIGVRVSPVEKTSGSQTLRLLGRVTPDETRVYKVNAASDGYLSEVSGVTTGSLVKKDQWLATIFSFDARAPIQAYLTTLDVLDRAARSGQLAEQLRAGDESTRLSIERLKSVGMSELQIEELRRTRVVPVTVRILAPADGFVLARNASLGQKYERGVEWFRIADLRKIWIVADVFENDAPYLRPGAVAQVSLHQQRRSFSARVAEVLPQFDAVSRTLKVRLEADNADYALRPDMFADVELPIQLPPAITVPADAVLDLGQKEKVFVERGEGVFEPRAVQTGWRFGDRVQIVKGLEPGERVVTAGNFFLDSESRMRLTAIGASGHPAKDPVCGMDLDAAKVTHQSESGGEHYSFCSSQCQEKFEKNPGMYLKKVAGRSEVSTRTPAR